MCKQPDFSGRWRANLDRCRFSAIAPRSLDMAIEHAGDTLRQKVLTVAHDGAARKALFSCCINGELGEARLNGEHVASRVWWLGVELRIELVIPASSGELRLIDCWTLSDDLRTLIMAHHDDALAGQIVEMERVS